MRSTKGFTLTELLVVVGIILVLSGITYALLAPSRVKAKETSCINNSKQIFLAVSLYGQDYSDAHEFDELGGQVSMPSDYKLVLSTYGLKAENFYCPHLPVDVSAVLYSSYLFYNVAVEAPSFLGNGEIFVPAKLDRIRRLKEKAGDKMPLFFCPVHDELHYQKSDPPTMKTPFWIYVTTSGSARAERVSFAEGRPKMLALVAPHLFGQP